MSPRYWAFAYDLYYPTGGIDDRIGMFNTIEEAGDVLRSLKRDFCEIVDTETGDIVKTIDSE